MIEWILILALKVGSGTAAVTVDGFKDKMECMRAGHEAAEKINRFDPDAYYVCVQRTK